MACWPTIDYVITWAIKGHTSPGFVGHYHHSDWGLNALCRRVDHRCTAPNAQRDKKGHAWWFCFLYVPSFSPLSTPPFLCPHYNMCSLEGSCDKLTNYRRNCTFQVLVSVILVFYSSLMCRYVCLFDAVSQPRQRSLKILSILSPPKASMTAAKMLEQKQFYYSYFTVFHWWYFLFPQQIP